jgi:hypothetical protein
MLIKIYVKERFEKLSNYVVYIVMWLCTLKLSVIGTLLYT